MERIDGEEELYRRILHYQYNEETGRISSSAFMRKNKLDPEVSVFRARLSDPSAVLDAGLPRQLLAVLKAKVAYELGLNVDPQPTDRFPGHCVITGFGRNLEGAMRTSGRRIAHPRPERSERRMNLSRCADQNVSDGVLPANGDEQS